MNKNLRISIPDPCHEDWNKMTPEEKGRFCGSCQKVVMDFTSMSDSQIIAYFKKAGENTCGRFHNDQLNRDMVPVKKRLPWVKYFFQVAIPALFFSYRATAQGKPVVKEKVRITKGLEGTVGFISYDVNRRNEQKVNGKVTNAKGEGIPFASVIWKGTERGISTNEDGTFSLERRSEDSILTISSVGYINKELSIKNTNSSLNIILEETSSQPFVGLIVIPSNTVTGIVTDEDGEILPDATVHVKGTGEMVKTDDNGYFLVRLKNKKTNTVVIEHVGYETVEVKAKAGTDHDVVMKKKMSALEEVIVTAPSGYLTGRLYTGSVSTVTNCTIQKTNLWDKLFGSTQSFVIYPNPVRSASELKIEWKEALGEYKWEIIDVAGRIIRSATTEVTSKMQTVVIQLPAAPPGSYILRFTNRKGKSFSGKFVIRD